MYIIVETTDHKYIGCSVEEPLPNVDELFIYRDIKFKIESKKLIDSRWHIMSANYIIILFKEI